MATLFWPVSRASAPSAAARLGRVLHWTAIAATGLCVLIVLACIFNKDGLAAEDAVIVAVIGFLILMAGRGLRYVLAGE